MHKKTILNNRFFNRIWKKVPQNQILRNNNIWRRVNFTGSWRQQKFMTRDEQLVKDTITELKYDSIKSKLIKIFSDNSEVLTPEFNSMYIETGPVYYT